jgi:hypothetical protein
LDAHVAVRRAAAKVLLLLLVPQADAARITTDNLLEVRFPNNVQSSLGCSAVQAAAAIAGRTQQHPCLGTSSSNTAHTQQGPTIQAGPFTKYHSYTWFVQDYERRFQSLIHDYSKLQQEHKQQTSEVEVLSKVSSSAAFH